MLIKITRAPLNTYIVVFFDEKYLNECSKVKIAITISKV